MDAEEWNAILAKAISLTTRRGGPTVRKHRLSAFDDIRTLTYKMDIPTPFHASQVELMAL